MFVKLFDDFVREFPLNGETLLEDPVQFRMFGIMPVCILNVGALARFLKPPYLRTKSLSPVEFQILAISSDLNLSMKISLETICW